MIEAFLAGSIVANFVAFGFMLRRAHYEMNLKGRVRSPKPLKKVQSTLDTDYVGMV